MELRIVENDRGNTTLPLSIMLHDDKMYKMEKIISNMFMRLFNAISYCFEVVLCRQPHQEFSYFISIPYMMSNHDDYNKCFRKLDTKI